MTEQEWLSSNDPAAMLGWLPTHGHEVLGQTYPHPLRVTDRKLRLFSVACMEIARGKSWSHLKEFYAAAETDARPTSMHSSVKSCSAIDQATAWCAGHPEPPTSPVKAALLREIFGNPFRPILASQSARLAAICATGTDSGDRIRRVAQRIYNERDWDAMPVLADMLEESGCEQEELLRHLRGFELQEEDSHDYCLHWVPIRGPHVRGCHALDSILGLQ